MAPLPVPPPADEAHGAPPTPPLVVQDAALQTANLGVQAVLLQGRRLTMAGFRQLLEEPVLDAATGRLRGNVWGWVNYHPDGCAAAPPHRHVLWQLGSELRRARVPQAALDIDPQELADDPALSPLWGQPFAEVTQRLLQRLRLWALCVGLREPVSPLEEPPPGSPAAAAGDAPDWMVWANTPDPAGEEVGHAIWHHLRDRGEAIRAWAGVPPDAPPPVRPPTEAEAGRARALAAWIADLEARDVQVEDGERGPNDEVGLDIPEDVRHDASTWRLVLLGSRSLYDVDVPLLFGTSGDADASDALDLPGSPVRYSPADEWAGERIELAAQIAYDEHPATGQRRVPTGPAPAPGYVRTTRVFPAVVQARHMTATRMGASQSTFYLTRLLEQHAQEAGVPVAYVRDAGAADGAWEEARAVTPETLAAVRAALDAAHADWQAHRERLLGSAAAVGAAPHLFVAV